MGGTEWLRDYEQKVEDIGARARRARDALDGLTATASSAMGAVTATVTPSGVLQSLSFGSRAEDLSRPRLAEAVLEAVRTAHVAAARKSADALQPLLGDSEASRYLAAQIPDLDG